MVERQFLEVLRDPNRLEELGTWIADCFLVEDHRKIVGFPVLDKSAFIEARRLDWEMDHERVSSTAVVVAVRGDRLALSRYTSSYADGAFRETLGIARWDAHVQQMERFVLFDPGDIDPAIAELDRLHAEIRNQSRERPA